MSPKEVIHKWGSTTKPWPYQRGHVGEIS